MEEWWFRATSFKPYFLEPCHNKWEILFFTIYLRRAQPALLLYGVMACIACWLVGFSVREIGDGGNLHGGLVCHPKHAPVIWLGRGGLKTCHFYSCLSAYPGRSQISCWVFATVIHHHSRSFTFHVNLFNLEPLETPHYKTQFERMQDPTGWWQVYQVSLTSLQYRKQKKRWHTHTDMRASNLTITETYGLYWPVSAESMKSEKQLLTDQTAFFRSSVGWSSYVAMAGYPGSDGQALSVLNRCEQASNPFPPILSITLEIMVTAC